MQTHVHSEHKKYTLVFVLVFSQSYPLSQGDGLHEWRTLQEKSHEKVLTDVAKDLP